MNSITRLPNIEFQSPLLLLLSKLLHQHILQGWLTDLLQFVSYALMWLLDLHHARKIDRRADDNQIHIGLVDCLFEVFGLCVAVSHRWQNWSSLRILHICRRDGSHRKRARVNDFLSRQIFGRRYIQRRRPSHRESESGRLPQPKHACRESQRDHPRRAGRRLRSGSHSGSTCEGLAQFDHILRIRCIHFIDHEYICHAHVGFAWVIS